MKKSQPLYYLKFHSPERVVWWFQELRSAGTRVPAVSTCMRMERKVSDPSLIFASAPLAQKVRMILGPAATIDVWPPPPSAVGSDITYWYNVMPSRALPTQTGPVLLYTAAR